MKKLLSFLLVILMLTGIFFAVANFTATDLEAWQHCGTYWTGDIGWICTGPCNDCLVGGPDI